MTDWSDGILRAQMGLRTAERQLALGNIEQGCVDLDAVINAIGDALGAILSGSIGMSASGKNLGLTKLNCEFILPCMEVFDQVIEKVGSQTALAELCKVSPQAITKWRKSGIPPKQCRTIEAATGIPAAELCPDVFGPAPAEAERAA